MSELETEDKPKPESEPKPLEERLRFIEISLEVQGENLTNIHEMLLEQDRLTESIGRLGEGAGSLSVALLQVDAQQKILTRLGEDLQQVKEHSATTEDVEEKVAEAKELAEAKLKATRRKLVRWLTVVVMLAVIIAYFTVQYLQSEKADRIANCERQQRTNAAVVGYLQSVADNSSNPEIKQSAQDVIGALPAPAALKACE
jgi:hypothetical protein